MPTLEANGLRRLRGPRRRPIAQPDSHDAMPHAARRRSQAMPRGCRGKRLRRINPRLPLEPPASKTGGCPVPRIISIHDALCGKPAPRIISISNALDALPLGTGASGGRFACDASARRWRHSWRRWRQTRPSGHTTVGQNVRAFYRCFVESGGPVGRLLRRGHGKRIPLSPGVAVDEVLPLPLLRRSDLPRASRCEPQAAIAWTNLVVVTINLLHSGREEGAHCTHAPSAAQMRMLLGIHQDIDGFFREAPRWPTDSEIKEYLCQSSSYRPACGAAVPLGDRGGVPASAADINVSEVLADFRPEVAEQARNPRILLLPPSKRPARCKRPHSRLADSYPRLVRRNCAAGLQRLVQGKHVWKHNGKRMVAGTFGIQKSDTEDRVISDLPVNDLIDPCMVCRPRFGYPPLLRTLVATKGRHLVVRKRDLEHYFHHLRLGRRWHKFLAHPPILVDGHRQYPLHQSAPMGASFSAGFTQAVTDKATDRLPADRKVRFDDIAPKEWPVWGTIIDDL